MKAEPNKATRAPRSGSLPSLGAEDRFSRVVEASPSALVLVGQTGQIEMVNRQAERMFGYDRTALLGEPLEILLPQRFHQRHVDLRNGFLTDTSVRVMGEARELFGLRKDGVEFPLEIGLNPIDIDGERMVLAAIVDSTARRTVELENEQQRQELARSKDRFARVVEASPSALVLARGSGRIEMVNRQAERMFGYDRAELLGQQLEVLLPVRFRPRHAVLRDGFLADMLTRAMDEREGLFGLRKDGTEFPAEIGLSPIDIDGEPMVLAAIIDVTARCKIELENERQRQELARSNSDLEEFACAVSHDLKAPLRAILHLVQWIDEDVAATASQEARDNLRLLGARATRLQMLLDGLLAYSRVGHAHPWVEDVDIAEVVRDVVATLVPPPGFVVACEGTMAVIRTHRMPIRVVLGNLIGNGLNHHDRSEGRITVSTRQIDGETEFRITDDGPGIEPRFHDRIFTMFQTLPGRDDVEPSGIGLAIVKKKVLAHGGRIWIESAPPVRGATFAFTWKEAAG
jgi:PAS domain S-box-containing protein